MRMGEDQLKFILRKVNNNIMDSYPLFSKLVGVARLNLSSEKLKEAQTLVKEYKFKDANFDATYASISKHVLEDRALNFLARAIDTQFQIYTRDLMKYLNSFKMTTSWITYVKPGAGSHEHNHNNSMISGVAFIECPAKCGNITFHNKNTGLFELPHDTINLWNAVSYSFEPQANTILFFPSSVYHKVNENKSNQGRYSIAFNYLPIGEAGSADSKVMLT